MEGEIAAKAFVSKVGEHRIAEFPGEIKGPTLIVVGSLHGNEPSGAQALRNVASRLERMDVKLRGRVVFIEGNTRALAREVRFIDSDLNRYWTKANLTKAALVRSSNRSEDLELSELFDIFREVMRTAENEVFVLDLHSTSAEGLPFATVGDTLRNRHFARKFPVTILLGIEEQLQGTMLEYLNKEGAVTLGFEAGQHNSTDAIVNHEALVWLALVNAEILDAKDTPDLETRRRALRLASGRERIVEVRHRESISANDEFVMNAGFNNFDPIKSGQILAHNRCGDIRAVESGVILMPLYQKQGEDGFFIGREVASFWIWLSEILRRMKVAALMPLVPGVKRHPDDPESLIVNTNVARFFPLQIFHLLGFRRLQWEQNHLVVSRRKHDTRSPFTHQSISGGQSA